MNMNIKEVATTLEGRNNRVLPTTVIFYAILPGEALGYLECNPTTSEGF